MLAEISGMDRFTPPARRRVGRDLDQLAMIRAYHASRGEGDQRDEIITTIFSHPSNAAAAKVAGFKVITLYPNADGYPDLEALRAAVSERTAAILITNPEDTGIFNPLIDRFVRRRPRGRRPGFYDQANANGILGITRAREAGFDVCHFNVHKTFGTPHFSAGPAGGALGVTREPGAVPALARRSNATASSSSLTTIGRVSIGKVKAFLGIVPGRRPLVRLVLTPGPRGSPRNRRDRRPQQQLPDQEAR